MSAKILVLILAASLLGAGPLCRCEGHAPTRPKKASCSHCPSESSPQPRGFPVSGCCCVHEGSDRVAEDQFSLPSAPVTFAMHMNPPALGVPIETLHAESTNLDSGVVRRAGPALYILFQHFTI